MDVIFRVGNDDKLGRHGIALQDIHSGCVVIDEIPFACGPKSGTEIVCLACCKPITLNSDDSRCALCQWPLCKSCWGASVHQTECDIFKNAKVRFAGVVDCNNRCPQLECITPLRVLLKKESDPERWEREVEPMEYHEAARRECQDTWNADLINVARYLRGPCKLSRFTEELIMRVIGILQVNAFEARTPHGYPLRCLFPQAAIFAHNCVPNTIRTIYPTEGYRIKLRTLIDVKKDKPLVVSYTYILDGTAERQQHLNNGKYFTCRCERCSDPTELGTYYSSIKCKKCDSGYLSTLDSFDNTCDWKCNRCEYSLPSVDIVTLLNTIQSEVSTLEKMPYNDVRLECTDRLHRKYHSILHPTHFIQTNLRFSLIQMYGRVKGYDLYSLPDFLVEYKIELCRLVLKVLDVFEPGLSRSRASALYELYAPLAFIARKLYSSGLLSADTYNAKLVESISYLQEAVQIFENEDPASAEGLLAAAGRKMLEKMQETVKMLDMK